MVEQMRTKTQKDADALDLQVFRVIRQLETFAETLRGRELQRVDDAISGLRYARGTIRRSMHPDDVQATVENG